MNFLQESRFNSLDETKSIISEYYGLFAIFSIINYLIPLFFIFPEKGSPHDWTLAVHIISAFLCVGLLFFDLLPHNLKIVRKYYCSFSLCFCLPFFSSIMFLHKSALLFWCTGLCLSAFLLAILLEYSEFIKVFSVGVVSACIIVLILDGYQVFKLWSISYLLYICGFSVAVGMVFARKKEETHRKTIENLRSLSATIAHEMRTPLSTIAIASQNFDKYLGEIITGYKEFKISQGRDANIIDDRILVYLENAPSDIYKISRKNLQLIDMLLRKFKGVDGVEELELCSIKACVLRAIEEYAFQKNERDLVVSEVEDFKFFGVDILFIHVLFNLISNSLRQINMISSGSIKLWTSKNNSHNIFHFCDYATGINAEIIEDIFLPFNNFCEDGGTGIGLSFCRDVVEKFNGTITCVSDGSTFTEFQIKFPMPN